MPSELENLGFSSSLPLAFIKLGEILTGRSGFGRRLNPRPASPHFRSEICSENAIRMDCFAPQFFSAVRLVQTSSPLDVNAGALRLQPRPAPFKGGGAWAATPHRTDAPASLQRVFNRPHRDLAPAPGHTRNQAMAALGGS